MLSVIRRISIGIATALLFCVAASSCSKLIFEYEGDCKAHYMVKFRYDRNLKSADAFASEVKSVVLYVIDPSTGKVIHIQRESGEALAKADYRMELLLEKGSYDLLAWCDNGMGKDFVVPEAKEKTGLKCSLKTKTDAASGRAYIDSFLDGLYHGHLEGVEFTADEGTTVAEMSLTKNTKTVRLTMQQIADMPMSKENYDFFITDDSGDMDWDNALMPGGKTVDFRAWSVREGSVTVKATSDQRSIIMTEFSTGRWVERGHNPVLVVKRKNGRPGGRAPENGGDDYDEDGTKVIFSAPLIQWALLLRGQASDVWDSQEFLDRQDEFNMALFLNGDDVWEYVQINVLGYKLVIQNREL